MLLNPVVKTFAQSVCKFSTILNILLEKNLCDLNKTNDLNPEEGENDQPHFLSVKLRLAMQKREFVHSFWELFSAAPRTMLLLLSCSPQSFRLHTNLIVHAKA